MFVVKLSDALGEVKSNNRLQWMILLVLAILLISLAKFLLDYKANLAATYQQEQRVYERLYLASQTSVPDGVFHSSNEVLDNELSNLRSSPSLSVAEAEAITYAETVTKNFSNRNIILVGAKGILQGLDLNLWEVRLELTGKISSSDFPQFLAELSKPESGTRIVTMRYRMGRQNQFYAVVDVLFKEKNDKS